MLPNELSSNAETCSEQGIKDFLAKPYPYQSGSLQSTDISSTFANYKLFYSFLSNEPYASKLKGFMGIRADVVITLVVNANKFQAGRYILAYSPFGGTGLLKAEAISNGTRAANLTTITQLPHVEIDLATQTSVSIEIPYVSVYSHLPIVPPNSASTHVLGEVKIFPYSALVSTAGSTSCSYDLFVSFKNVSLAAPCYPQSGKFNAAQGEQKAKGVGPVTSALRIASSISNLIGDKVPTLSALAAPVTWALDLMSGVASVFGWSNPINLERAYRVNQVAYAYANNCDNIDNSLPLSLFSGNTVEVLPGFAGNDIDEMSIDYIKSIPAWVTTQTWSTTDASDSVLYSTEVSPNIMQSTIASGLNTVYCMTPVCFLSNLFNLYRGGLRFTFKIVKTEFHSGRLSVVFNPSVVPGASVFPNNTGSTYCHREIIDIREGNSFDFIVPYVSLSPYKQCQGNFSSIGSLQIRVLNPLIAPATVSTTISIIVEVAGAPDMEFAVPAQHTMQAVAIYNPQSSSFIPKRDENSIISGVIGSSELKTDNHFSARACVGEKIVSLLSLLKKNDILPIRDLLYVGKHYVIDPFSFPLPFTTVTNATGTDHQNDNLALVSSLYLLNRGSTRWRVFSYSSNTVNILASTLLPTDSNTAIYSSKISSASSAPKTHALEVYNTNTDASLAEVQVPQYNRFHSRIWYDSTYDASTHGIAYGAYPTTSQVQLQVYAPDAALPDFGRQAGDDFQCGYFIGVPPIVKVIV